MATPEKSVFECPSVLFKSLSPIPVALQETTLAFYVSRLPTFASLLNQLKIKGMFLNKESIEYDVDDFLETQVDLSRMSLECPVVQLLIRPLSSATTSMDLLTESECLPQPFLRLSDKIQCYIAMIGDVLTNRLAQKPYDKEADREDVTEQEHALQAGKIAYLLNMPLGEILALLLHDIARPSIDDPEHGHTNHNKEGSVILSPLGLPIDFSGYHTFAKYLLYYFCPPYKDLISATSKRTLDIQTKDLDTQFGSLAALAPEPLALNLFKLMFMRLIDDMSKVPAMELNKQLGGGKPEYFDPLLIQKLLNKQMNRHLNQIMEQSLDIPASIIDTEEQLDAAILLLLRAKDYSNAPKLYEMFDQTISAALFCPS